MRKGKFVPRTKVAERIDEIVKYATGNSVLNIGMGGYIDDPTETEKWSSGELKETVHVKISNVATELVGLDINPSAVEAVKRIAPGEYYIGDITDTDVVRDINRSFELIVFGEVIEHLDCCRAALENIRCMTAQDGMVILTTVNAFSFERFFKMTFSYESVHDEHTSYYSYFTMKRLLAMNGLEIVDFYFCKDTRKTFGSFLEFILYHFTSVVTKIFPQFSQGIFVVARPVNQDFSSISK